MLLQELGVDYEFEGLDQTYWAQLASQLVHVGYMILGDLQKLGSKHRVQDIPKIL